MIMKEYLKSLFTQFWFLVFRTDGYIIFIALTQKERKNKD